MLKVERGREPGCSESDGGSCDSIGAGSGGDSAGGFCSGGGGGGSKGNG